MSKPYNTRVSLIDKAGRLKKVSLNGKSMRADLTESCVAASVSSSMSSISEMKFTFTDSHDATLFRSGVFQDGMVISFEQWRGRIKGGGRLKPSRGGPQVEVTAPSLFVHKLQSQTGARNWGHQSVNQWMKAQCDAVGIASQIEPYVGYQTIAREAPDKDSDGEPQSTWDVMVELADKYNCWLFEHSARLIFAKPQTITNAMYIRREVPLRWNGWGDMSDALMGMPDFTPGEQAEQKLRVQIVGDDADRVCPGDTVIMSGRLNGGTRGTNANGRWLVSDITIPLTRREAVTLDCIRPVRGAL